MESGRVWKYSWLSGWGDLPATSPPFTSRLATWLSIDIPLVESLRISLIEIHGLMDSFFDTRRHVRRSAYGVRATVFG